jgi:hypothetical protein
MTNRFHEADRRRWDAGSSPGAPCRYAWHLEKGISQPPLAPSMRSDSNGSATLPAEKSRCSEVAIIRSPSPWRAWE